MSDEQAQHEQQATQTAVSEGDSSVSAEPGMTDEHRWGDPIPPERQAELQSYLDRWQAETDHGQRKGPFDGGPAERGMTLTGADVSWLAERSGRDKFGQVPNLHLEGANLEKAHLEGARLTRAHLEGAHLYDAHLEGGALPGAYLEGAFLRFAHLELAQLYEAHLEGADLVGVHLERANLHFAHLEWAELYRAHLEGAYLEGAHLEGARLEKAHLEGARLEGAHLEGKRMPTEELRLLRQWRANYPERLSPADLRGVFMSPVTDLAGVTLGSREDEFVRVADVTWGGVNLAILELPPAHLLGDEQAARATKGKTKRDIINVYQAAVRANRQLAVALQGLGLNEEAVRFAYRAQVLQRTVFRRQGKAGAYLFSLLLAALAGYGYRLWRILVAYGLALAAFATAYFAAGQWWGATHLSPYEAFIVSLTAIHGRVFFATFGLDSVQSLIAALESIVGIVIEGVFVAMLIQRFFAR
jgi:uncharacterized protein YjbI with pentapeptide repeats